jgi:hypothetical protein
MPETCSCPLYINASSRRHTICRTREAVHKKIDEERISKEAASMKRDKRCSRIDGSYRRRDDHTSRDMQDIAGGMQRT